MAIPMTTDIEIEIHSETVNSEFLIVPNALLRGEGVWRDLRLTERAMLGALLTLPSSGWKTSRARVEAMASGHGRDAVTKILNGLRERHHLYTRRVKVGNGKFRWLWRVYMFPQPEGFDPFTDEVGDGGERVSAGRAIDWKPGHGKGVDGSDLREHPVSAGRAIDWKPGHGKGVDGSDLREHPVSAGRAIDVFPVTGNTSLKEKEPSLKERSKTPPTPHAAATDHASGLAATEGGGKLGGDKPQPQPQPQERADDVVEILSVRPDWRRGDVVSVLDEVVSQGTSRDLAVASLRDLAAGRYGHTVSPRRLLANGPWSIPGATFAPAPSLSADDMCLEHRGQLRASCACCWGERLGAGADGVRERPSGRTTMPDSVLDLLPARVRSSRAVRGGASR